MTREQQTTPRGTVLEGGGSIRIRGSHSPKLSVNEASSCGLVASEQSNSPATTPSKVSPEPTPFPALPHSGALPPFYQGCVPPEALPESIKGACLLIQSLRCDPCFSLYLCPYGCFAGTALGRVIGFLFEPVEGPRYYADKRAPQVVSVTQHTEFVTAQSNLELDRTEVESCAPVGADSHHGGQGPANSGRVGARGDRGQHRSTTEPGEPNPWNDETFLKKKSFRSRLVEGRGPCSPVYFAYPKTLPKGRLQLYSGHAVEAAKAVYADATNVYAVIGSSLLQKWDRLSPHSPIRLEMETAQQRWSRSATKFVLQWRNTAVIMHPGNDGWQQRVNMTDCMALRPDDLKGDYVPCDFSDGKLLVTVRQKSSPAVAMIFFLPDPDLTRAHQHWKYQFPKSAKMLSHFKFWEPDRIVYTKGGRTIIAHNYRTDRQESFKGHLDDIVSISAESAQRIITMGRDSQMRVWTDHPAPSCLITIDCSPATFFSGYTQLLTAYGPLVAFSADQGIFFTNLLTYPNGCNSHALRGWQRPDLDRAFASMVDSSYKPSQPQQRQE